MATCNITHSQVGRESVSWFTIVIIILRHFPTLFFWDGWLLASRTPPHHLPEGSDRLLPLGHLGLHLQTSFPIWIVLLYQFQLDLQSVSWSPGNNHISNYSSNYLNYHQTNKLNIKLLCPILLTLIWGEDKWPTACLEKRVHHSK